MDMLHSKGELRLLISYFTKRDYVGLSEWSLNVEERGRRVWALQYEKVYWPIPTLKMGGGHECRMQVASRSWTQQENRSYPRAPEANVALLISQF